MSNGGDNPADETNANGEERRASGGNTNVGHPPANWLGRFAAILVGLLCVLFAFGLLGPGRFFESLKDPNYARGVIMFMVSTSAVLIGFIVVIYAFFGVRDQQSESRFRRAREIFVSMMGVLGTIVGFYFGQTNLPEVNDALEKPAIDVVDGEVTVHMTSGIPPYSYTVEFEDTAAETLRKTSDNGWIRFDLRNPSIPGFVMTVEDQMERSTTLEYEGE